MNYEVQLLNMVRLLMKMTLYLSFLWIGSQLLIKPFIYHPFWGDPDYIVKFDRFFSSPNDFNTVFVGSSRTMRHIDPIIFDSITGLNSFNFGIDGVGCPFNYQLCKEILDSKESEHLTFMFLELFSPRTNLTEEVMHTDKVIYRYGFDDFYFTIRSTFQDRNMTFRQKLNEVSLHSKNLIETSFRFGQFHRISNSIQKHYYDRGGISGRGFVNGSAEVMHLQDSFLISSHDEILQHPEILNNQIKNNRFSYFNPKPCDNCFKYHWDYISKIQQTCDSKGIILILMVQPLMNERHAEFIGQFLLETPTTMKILNYADSERFPKYYRLENVFDKGHLNERGATLFTTNLALDVHHIYQHTAE